MHKALINPDTLVLLGLPGPRTISEPSLLRKPRAGMNSEGVWEAVVPWGHPCLLSPTFLSTKSPFDVPCKGFGHAPIWAWLGGGEVPRRTQSRGLTQAPEGVLHCSKGGPGQLPAGGGEQVGPCQQAAPWPDRW